MTRGGRGGAKFKKLFFFQNFCLYYFGGHTKFQFPTICPYWVLSTVATTTRKEKNKEKNTKNSGLRLSDTVCTATLRPKYFVKKGDLSGINFVNGRQYQFISKRKTGVGRPATHRIKMNKEVILGPYLQKWTILKLNKTKIGWKSQKLAKIFEIFDNKFQN